MAWDPHVQQLLEQLLESGTTPEEVCATCPDLLPLVRQRWQRLRLLQAQVRMLFPEPGSIPPVDAHGPVPPASDLPRIPGYEVQAVLGHGGMGVVYRARHLRLNRPVALKMLLAGAYADAEQRERFLREAEAVACLQHPNIVQVYDVADHDGRPYYTMELVEGGSLAQKLSGAPLPARQAAALVATLAVATEVAHQHGIIHRDLKPANVLLAAPPSGAEALEGTRTRYSAEALEGTRTRFPLGTPKISDFGLARRLQDSASLTQSGATLGTPSYMAPEQAEGRAIGPAVDVYALGTILYELLTGRPPFRGETSAETLLHVIYKDPLPPSRCNARVPHDLEIICLKCLHKEPSRRYASAAALADDLRRFLQGKPIAARRGRLEALVQWWRLHPVQAGLLAGTFLLALVLAGGAGLRVGQRTAIRRAVEAHLQEAARLQQQSAFAEAGAALERARARLGDHGPDWLYPVLEQACRDQKLLVRLEAIRLQRATFVEGRWSHAAEMRFNLAQADRDYEEAFRNGQWGDPPNDPEGVAARLKASPLGATLVAALDDWAVCTTDKARQDWLLHVARQADPDPWRDRVRDPAAWDDAAALAELARTVPVAEQPVPCLLALAERLQMAGGHGTELLRRVQEAHPDDFWTNFTLARILHGEGRHHRGDPGRAVAYYHQALKLRPRAAAVHNDLGLVLFEKLALDDNPPVGGLGALGVYRQALEIDPTFAPALNNLGLALAVQGKWDQAIPSFQEAVRVDPRLAPAHFNLAEVQVKMGQLDEALGHYRQALRIDPNFALADHHLSIVLAAKDRLDRCGRPMLGGHPGAHPHLPVHPGRGPSPFPR
jgi:serine/threonine-protein kinase